MSGVGTWRPGAPPPLDGALLARLLAAAADLDAPQLGFSDAEVERFAGLARLPADTWREAAADRSDAELVALIRLFTLAEMRLSGWEAGARSPVVPLAAVLRARGAYSTELTRWIKAHSDNRFLPYGSLLDKL